MQNLKKRSLQGLAIWVSILFTITILRLFPASAAETIPFPIAWQQSEDPVRNGSGKTICQKKRAGVNILGTVEAKPETPSVWLDAAYFLLSILSIIKPEYLSIQWNWHNLHWTTATVFPV